LFVHITRFSYANLINTYTDVPESVEILDLSSNKITTIDDLCLKVRYNKFKLTFISSLFFFFQTYSVIVKLYLSRNTIDTISLDAFSHMKSMTHLDLSENRLEIVDGRLFQDNARLIDLNLAGNKFMSIEDKPILYSKSLLVIQEYKHTLFKLISRSVSRFEQQPTTPHLSFNFPRHAKFKVTRSV
jgi:Leucine-rich repeat (LRR) protein